jgi:hypothetical protein
MARRTTATSPSTSAATPRTSRSRASTAATAAPAATARVPAPRREPTVDEIRRRAYEIYLDRRGVGGSPESDWLQAERELRGF